MYSSVQLQGLPEASLSLYFCEKCKSSDLRFINFTPPPIATNQTDGIGHYFGSSIRRIGAAHTLRLVARFPFPEIDQLGLTCTFLDCLMPVALDPTSQEMEKAIRAKLDASGQMSKMRAM